MTKYPIELHFVAAYLNLSACYCLYPERERSVIIWVKRTGEIKLRKEKVFQDSTLR